MNYAEELTESVAQLRDDHEALKADHETLKGQVQTMVQTNSARFDKQDIILESIRDVVGAPPKPLAKTAEERSGWGMAKAVVESGERRKFAGWLYVGLGVIVALSAGAMAVIKLLEFLITHQVK